MKPVIVVNPFQAEFSYELQWHMPLVRELFETKYKDYYKVVIGLVGKRGMYRDFVDEYISYPLECIGTDARVEDGMESKNPWECVLGGKNKVLEEFYEKTMKEIKKRFDVVETYDPDYHIKTLQENPSGTYKHITLNPEVDLEVMRELKESFDDDRPIISMMAKIRFRRDGYFGRGMNAPDKECWKKDNWIELIKLIIDDLGCNIALIGVPQVDEYPGSYDFLDEPELNGYRKNLVSFVANGEDSLDRQISLLNNTVCSFYGCTGAAILAFFTNTPMFSQQTVNDGWRLCFPWQLRLTNNHEKVFLFNKYPLGDDIYNSPVQELYEHFKGFFNKIKK